MNATGWSCYTIKGETQSDTLATCLHEAAEHILKDQVIRTDYARDGDPDWKENFYYGIPYALLYSQSSSLWIHTLTEMIC